MKINKPITMHAHARTPRVNTCRSRLERDGWRNAGAQWHTIVHGVTLIDV